MDLLGSNTNSHATEFEGQSSCSCSPEQWPSRPEAQFQNQTLEVARHLVNTRISFQNVFDKDQPEDVLSEARKIVKNQWIEQDIWDKNWDKYETFRYVGISQWKHEKALVLPPEVVNDTGLEYALADEPDEMEETLIPITTDCVVRERERERERKELIKENNSSRPLHQFNWQASKEEMRLHMLGYLGQTQPRDPYSVHPFVEPSPLTLKACKIVKQRWMKWGIWHESWVDFPGLKWAHDIPLEKAPHRISKFNPIPPEDPLWSLSNERRSRSSQLFSQNFVRNFVRNSIYQDFQTEVGGVPIEGFGEQVGGISDQQCESQSYATDSGLDADDEMESDGYPELENNSESDFDSDWEWFQDFCQDYNLEFDPNQ